MPRATVFSWFVLFLAAWATPTWLLAQAPPAAPGSQMVLKNGTIYLLKEPPRISGGRIVFTTMEGKVYSLAESEVDSIGLAPKPTPTPRVTYSPQDTRALGAIARQQRVHRGLSSPIAPPSTPRPAASGRRAKPKRARRPALSPTPSRASDTTSHG